jgi:ATP-dependent helicase/nuclease subunit A
LSSLTIYKSSAGSGKTYTLVLEYLKLVIIDPGSFKNVLAVTFTNKATEEMKARIISTLSMLATSPPEALEADSVYQHLKAHLISKKKAHLDVSRQARKVLEQILNDYSSFSVSTIESFFQKIVRAFARELNIPLGYDVEMKQGLVLEQVVTNVLMDIGTNAAMTELFRGFVERNLEEDKTWNVDVEIKSLGSQIFKEKFQQLIRDYPDEQDRIQMTLNLAKELRGIREKFENHFKSLSQRALEVMERYHLEIADFSRKGSGPGAYVLRFLDKVPSDKFAPNSYVMKAYESPDGWYAKSSKRKDDILAAVNGGLGQILAEMVSMYENGFRRYNTAIQVARTIYSFGVMNDLKHKLENYRRENNQLIISDTSFLLSSVVSSEYDAPFIYEKVGNRYRHYLIDEFQDTSDMQWYNLLPLVREALSYGVESLIVGDVKQSIYRWRNGNMRLLMEEVEKNIEDSGQKVNVKDLQNNYRTAQDIVDFNNSFFNEAADLLAREFPDEDEQIFSKAYEAVAQKAQKTNFPGWVSLEFFQDRGFKDPPEIPGWREQALERVYEIILDLKEKGYQGRDITFLVRKNSDGMEVAEFLQKKNIKVVSAESLLVVSDKRVLLLQALLQHLNHEKDPVVKAALAYYYALVVEEKNGDHDLFSRKDNHVLSPEFEKLKPTLRKLPVYECLERLISLFPVLALPNAYVQGFMDAVLEYSTNNDASISGFLQWWEEIKDSKAIASAPEAEAVQIMTIHKSKGLEFPIVIMPFTEWDMEPNTNDVLWVKPDHQPYESVSYLPVRTSQSLLNTYFDEEFAEERLMSYLDNLNLLYVAFTRPEFRLYVLTKKKSSQTRGLKKVSSLIGELVEAQVLDGEITEEPYRFTRGAEISQPELEKIFGHKKDDSEENLELQPNPELHADWNRAIRIRFSSNRYLNTDILARQDKISRGELLHDTLAHIKMARDLTGAVEMMVRRGELSSEEKAGFENSLESIINLPEVKDWYSGAWQVRNEADIIASDGTLLRPDRVMIKGNKAIVVDYKTGKKNSKYPDQISAYINVLVELGYQEVQGFIYYINLGLLEEVA